MDDITAPTLDELVAIASETPFAELLSVVGLGEKHARGSR